MAQHTKEHKMEALKTWEEMTVLEQMQCQYWDMYKDAYGIRPRHMNLEAMTEADFEAEFKILGEVIEREAAIRKENEFKAEVDFEMRIQNLLVTGARDRAMALRWIHEAEGTGGDDEFLCWTVGLPYGYFRKVDKVAV
jgi:hypothetical protein